MASVENLTLTKTLYSCRMAEVVEVADFGVQVDPAMPVTRDRKTDPLTPQELAETDAEFTELMASKLLKDAQSLQNCIRWDVLSVNPACMAHLDQASAILTEVVEQDRVTPSQRPRGE